jgi:hypothetical protein
MKPNSYIVIRTARTSTEADAMIANLRAAGLHPLDLDASPYVSLAGTDFSFSIEVPGPEASQARKLLTVLERQSRQPLRWRA